jgi:hypothetical protein
MGRAHGKERRAPSQPSDAGRTTGDDYDDDDPAVPLNSKLGNFFLKMRAVEVENEELKQELQSLGERAKEEATDVSGHWHDHARDAGRGCERLSSDRGRAVPIDSRTHARPFLGSARV